MEKLHKRKVYHQVVTNAVEKKKKQKTGKGGQVREGEAVSLQWTEYLTR